MATINAAGTIEGASGLLQIQNDNGKRIVYRAHRDENGHVQLDGAPIFDAQRLWNERGGADRIEAVVLIREKRAALGWTQAQMADALGLTREHYTTMETGRANITARTMKQIERLTA